MIKYRVVFISFFILYNSCSQEEGLSFFSDGKIYTENKRGYEVSDLFKLTGDSVINGERKLIKINLPSDLKIDQAAWGSVQIGGFKNAKTKWEVFYIISDYDSANPKIIFDKNGNANFADDTAFTIQTDTPFYVIYKNPQDRNAEFKSQYKFYRGPVDSSREKAHKLLTYNKGIALPATYMILTKRYDIKKIQLPDSNIVSLKDVDFDGMFTTKYDKIIAGDLETNPALIKKPLQCKELRKGAELAFGNKAYKLISVNKYGSNISVMLLNKVIDTVERLSPISFSDENGNKKTLGLINDKQYSVFYIWGTWCIGCLYQSNGFAKLMNEYDSAANFYTLNVGDKRERMTKYISEKKYPFQAYQVSKETAEEKLFAEAFPTFIIADKNKKILLRTSSVHEVEKYLKDSQ